MDAVSAASGSTSKVSKWFLESGIQDSSGGVARYYRFDTQDLRAISTEITGYAAATLAYLHRRTGDIRCLEAATRAGLFLTRAAWTDELGTIPFEWGRSTETGTAPAYFFDLGIIARGLTALWRHTQDAEFLVTARACARSMARDFRQASGYCSALHLPGKAQVPADSRWSSRPGCYQLKPAMIWADLGDPDYAPLYDAALDGFLPAHSRFPEAEPEQERVMDRLHAYCYFLEGLLPRASRPECSGALKEGILRVETLLRRIAPSFERSDVRAQLFRLRLYAGALCILPLDPVAAEAEASLIRGFQLDSGDPRIDGAFCFGRKGGALMPFANPASTAFCVQALEMWEQHQRSEFRPDPLDLI
jgi:hypothetical protein